MKIITAIDFSDITQRLRLEREGVCFIGGRVPLNDYRWHPASQTETPVDYP